jgi:hypothetical protein
MIAVAVVGALSFIGWLIWMGVRRKPIKAHLVSYVLSCIAGAFTFAFFLTMDVSKFVKILVSILLGAVLIFVAAYYQRQGTSNR